MMASPVTCDPPICARWSTKPSEIGSGSSFLRHQPSVRPDPQTSFLCQNCQFGFMARFTMIALLFVLGLLDLLVAASPYNPRFSRSLELEHRTTDPVFPDTPPSCPICAQVSPCGPFVIPRGCRALPLSGGASLPHSIISSVTWSLCARSHLAYRNTLTSPPAPRPHLFWPMSLRYVSRHRRSPVLT
jgi:hypothetical protein